MTQQRSLSQRAYCQTVGTAPTGAPIIEQRDPNSSDVNYSIGQFWINQPTKSLWYLNSLTSTNALLQAVWELISVESILASISDTANTPVFASLNSDVPPDNIQLLAGAGISIVSSPATHLLTITNTGANSDYLPDTGTSPVSGSSITVTNTSIVGTGTLANAIRSNGTGASTIAYQVQYAGSNAAVSAVSKWGVAQFDSNQFNVTSGFVQLAGGGGAPTLGIVPDAHTAPGTTPVVPNGSGNIILEGGSTFLTGTQANPIRTNSLAANTIDLQIQLAGSNAASSTANDFGVAQFDSNQFTVTYGFVQVKNSGTTGVVTEVIGDDGLAVVPAAGTGAITLDGVTVLNAVNSKPVYFKKNAANTEELDVQLTTTSTSGTKNINKSGLGHFDDTFFTVDAPTGFVSLISGGGTITSVLTANATPQFVLAGTVETVDFGITNLVLGSTLPSLAGGTSNVGVGYQDLNAITSGSGNTAIGYQSGLNLTNGTNNTAIGKSSLITSTTSLQNVAVGNSSLQALTTSNGSNTAVGYGSLIALTTGTNNTALGLSAGSLYTTTESSNISIGNNGTIADQNTIRIGTQGAGLGRQNTAFMAGIVGVTNSNAQLVTIDSTTGQLGVNATGSPVTQFTLDAATTPISPSSGVIILTGGQVATGTVGANVIRTRGNAANSATIEIQRSTTAASADSTKNGVSHFNSTEFTVDSNGFVTSNNITINTTGTISGGGTVNLGGSITLTGSATGLVYTNVNTSPYVVLSTDQYLSVDTSALAITVQLPNSPTAERTFIIKDRTGSASTRNISVTTVGGATTIDGVTTYKITSNYGSIQLLYNGTSYEVY